MKAAVMEAFGAPLVVRDVPDPAPAPDGAVVRVEACGICRSDWHAWMGDWAYVQLPRILGHEFCGVVEAVGREVTRFRPGDRVIVPFNQGDGTCEYCRTGHANLCDRRVVPGIHHDGGFARFAAVPGADWNLVALPGGVSFRDAASLGCRFMTAFYGVVHQAQVRAGEWVAVFGCGGVGLAAVQVAGAVGAHVVAVDIDQPKLDLARQMGAVAGVDSRAADPVDVVRNLTRGGAHVAVDALGIPETCLAALKSLRKRGRHLQLGLTTQAEKGVIPLPTDQMVYRELRFIGSFGMPPDRYGELLPLVERGRLDPGRLVSREVALAEAGDVLAGMTRFAGAGVQVITRFD